MSDLAERLRLVAAHLVPGTATQVTPNLLDAADEIERLRAAITEASNALSEVSDAAGHTRSCPCLACVTGRFLTVALEGTTDE